MTESYIPRPDQQALSWMTTFSDNLAASPETYQLTSSDTDTILEAVDAFRQALIVAENTMTRNEGTVNAKNTARNAAETLCRQYAIQIKFNNGITDEQKIYVGVRPINDSREPIWCPQTSPLVNVVAATPGTHTVHYADSLEPNERKKPFGAAALQLFAYIGDGATVDENQAKFIGLYTRNPIAVAFEPDDDGKMATYFARWSGKRGDTGPYSLPVSMRIAA